VLDRSVQVLAANWQDLTLVNALSLDGLAWLNVNR